MGAGGARGGLTRLSDGLVGDAARVDDRNIGTCAGQTLYVAVAEQTLAHLMRVRVRDLAPEKANGKGRHGPGMLLGLRGFEPQVAQ